ncbi:MAG: HAD-superfamily hydrolase, subfamily IA, variant 3 [Candidatus Parvarchaeum acidiphilum ARMAN-4]|jgi:HAD superfamily hydrolase (TIGR01509 family)|uniref:HAD-superfamily hydrolase, subfamily IA, variant 3 n=1 Tax=Candidatus Parvarchaeum acidiphilum ARMAN-4 TaxID=662760 RepID=D2EFW2_PARA4|nr:MAG: HAD-superfamily hydrolase, subfamily IA, variant 3 [Candidatus Parvarchaeum acidiphilum ARMAN-4]
MIKGIASDLDGTLIDTAKLLAEAWEEAFKSDGIDVGYSELYKNTKGISSKDIIRKYKKESSFEDLNRIKEKRKLNFIRLVDQGNNLLYPETMKVIDEIRSKGIKFAISTGMSRDLLDKVLKLSGLDSIVDAVVSSDDVKNGKPAPDIFLEAFKRIDINPKEGIVVGDSENDIMPGKAIGAFTVFISREGSKSNLADANITNLEELLQFL